MKPFSVIVTAHNMEAVIVRTLQSVENALAFFHKHAPDQSGKGEIVVVDDGSSDGTWQRVNTFAADKQCYKLIRQSKSSSPSCARNVGVQESSGSLLFFLDGDDLFYPNHIAICLQAMQSPEVGFAKTQVHIADPIHADWVKPINHCVVINICVRRECHDAVGGFPDLLLCRREKDKLVPETDIFYKFEDMHYNSLITKLFSGVGINVETVENLRYPGNSFDRQYEKFQLPFGAYRKPQPEADNYRLQLCDAIIAHRLHELRSTHRTDERGFLCGVF